MKKIKGCACVSLYLEKKFAGSLWGYRWWKKECSRTTQPKNVRTVQVSVLGRGRSFV